MQVQDTTIEYLYTKDLNAKDREELAEVFAICFGNNPMHVGLGNLGYKEIRPIKSYLVIELLTMKSGYVAVARSKSQIVGFCFINDFFECFQNKEFIKIEKNHFDKDSILDLPPLSAPPGIDTPFREPILDLVTRLEYEVRSTKFSNLNYGQVLHIDFVGVVPSFGGYGIASRLIKLVLENGSYQQAICVVGNVKTGSILSKYLSNIIIEKTVDFETYISSNGTSFKPIKDKFPDEMLQIWVGDIK